MLIGILSALLAGAMLGLYALPGKYVKDFQEENKWSLFFLLTMFVVPLILTFSMMKGALTIYGGLDGNILMTMVVSSFLWGVGVMMWGKAIDHIGLSLGFSLFIGTVILVGSTLPLGISLYYGEPLPAIPVLALILIGLAIVLFGVLFNGKAGLAREKDEAAAAEDSDAPKKKSYATGIAIAVIGGLLATGFNVAFTVGGGPLKELVVANGNPEWMTAMAVMLPVFLSGGVVMTLYFAWQLTQKKAWGSFSTSALIVNVILIAIMAFFHYAASAMYAFAANALGANGPIVVYAIFNTTCLVIAVVSGILTGEWAKASQGAKGLLYKGLACMVVGVLVLTGSQYLASQTVAAAEPVEQIDTEVVPAEASSMILKAIKNV